MEEVPLRQCVDYQEMKSKKEMIRIIKAAGDEIMLNTAGRENGGGTYLCPSMGCLKKVVKGKGLERSFRMAIPKEVYETLEKEMEELGR